jgi:hypothetical protein
MTKRYAAGKRAWGECQRSGRKMLLRDMIEDGRYPGLMVDPAWREDKHPSEEPLTDIDDPIALRNPAPELSKPAGEGEAAPELTFDPF